MLLSVSKWRRILREKTETKSAPKTIFSGNGNGLNNFAFLSTREQRNVHTVYVKQDTLCVWVVNAYAIGCGVLATIEQWYPTRKFNGTMVPHKRNYIVWPHLVTIEKTIKYPTSAMCTVWVRVSVYRYRVWGTCNNRTMVPHNEIQLNNGTPQGKFYSLATLCHKREDNQVPHKCHV